MIPNLYFGKIRMATGLRLDVWGAGRGGYSEEAVGIALCRQRLWLSLGGDITVEMWGGG